MSTVLSPRGILWVSCGRSCVATVLAAGDSGFNAAQLTVALSLTGSKEIVMNCIHRILGVPTGLACALMGIIATGPAASAMILPPHPVSGGQLPVPPTVVTGGMAGWQITLIALGAALLAAAVAVAFDRARVARRSSPATSA